MRIYLLSLDMKADAISNLGAKSNEFRASESKHAPISTVIKSSEAYSCSSI
jgi:hypothetical protein